MSNLLPPEGRAPKPIGAEPRKKAPAPVVQKKADMMTLRQYAICRRLGTATGGFEHECKRLGSDQGRRTLSEWDAIYDSYRNRPIRG